MTDSEKRIPVKEKRPTGKIERDATPSLQAPDDFEDEPSEIDAEWDEDEVEKLLESGEEDGSRSSQPKEEVSADDEGEEQAPRPQRGGRFHGRRGPPESLRTLLEEELPERAQYADEKLKQHLMGSVLLRITSGGSEKGRGESTGPEQRYLLEWGTSGAQCKVTDATTADCCIRLSDQNLMRIAAGELNPQIAMLSDKLMVQGNLSLAIYFFNLVVPT